MSAIDYQAAFYAECAETSRYQDAIKQAGLQVIVAGGTTLLIPRCDPESVKRLTQLAKDAVESLAEGT